MDRTAFDPQSHTWLELGELQRLVFDQFPGLIAAFDLEGRLQWASPEGEKALGYAPGELKGQRLIGSLLRREEVEARAAMLGRALHTRVPADENVFTARLRRGLADEHAWVLRTKSGEPRTMTLSLGTLRDARGHVTGLIAVEQQRAPAAETPITLTHHDNLTGLPSRAVLHDRAEVALQRAARTQSHVGVLLVALEGFRALCEERGDSVGDDLLRAAAGRLHFELRKTDTAIRLDDGQFVVMLADLHNAGEAERVANKIANTLAKPVNTGVQVLQVPCRIGVATSPTQGDQLLPLIQAAERALQDARERHALVSMAAASAAEGGAAQTAPSA